MRSVNGDIYVMGNLNVTKEKEHEFAFPRKLNIDFKAADISCEGSNIAAVTEGGIAMFMDLTHKDCLNNFRAVEELQGLRFVSCSAGNDFTVYLERSGDVYLVAGHIAKNNGLLAMGSIETKDGVTRGATLRSSFSRRCRTAMNSGFHSSKYP